MRSRPVLITLAVLGLPLSAAAEADYFRMELSIAVDRSAEETWSKIGDYCDISEWLGLSCEITEGDGGIGTVRVLNGSIIEPMVAQTELSYGYTQPAVPGEFYNLYHGFMEARPVTDASCQILYTVMWDVSGSSEEEAQAAIERRRRLFGEGLEKMKEIAESE